MVILGNVLLAAAIVTAPAPPQKFILYKNYPGEYQLSIDENSIRILDDNVTPLVVIDIQIVMERPVRYIDTPITVKSYQNSIAVDCRNDRIFVVVARAFSTNGTMIYSTAKPEIINNNHKAGAPTTELIDLFCPPILERYKEIRPKINTWT